MKKYEVVIDFETYSEQDLKKVGVSKYAEHSSTEILCMSYCFKENGKILTHDIWTPDKKFPLILVFAVSHGAIFHAWNTGFERTIWNEVGIKRLGWPGVPFKAWRDVQAVALNLALPAKLGETAMVLELIEQKDERGKELTKLLGKPQKPTKKHPHIRRTVDLYPELFQELYDYCKQDVVVTNKLLEIFPFELSERELNIWRYTLLKNERGLPIDKEFVDVVVDLIDEYVEDICSMVSVITSGEVQKIGQTKAIIDWCKKQGVKLPNLRKETVKKCLDMPKLKKYPKVKSLLEIREKTGKSSIAKFKKIQQSLCKNNRLKDCFRYHGAVTGREKGNLFQPTNLPRARVKNEEKVIKDFKSLQLYELMGEYPNILKTASALIRPAIKAPKGKELIVCDFKQIENRVLFWLVGETRALKELEEGKCLYTKFAAKLFKKKYEDIKKGSEEYAVGKQAILAGIYGMGAKTFHYNCNEKNNVKISKEKAILTIDTFRKEYKKIQSFGYSIYNSAIKAIRNPEKLIKNDKLSFLFSSGILFVILPNGKKIAYPDAHLGVTYTKSGYKRFEIKYCRMKGNKWLDEKLYSWKLAQNATQSISRELFFDGVLALERNKIPVILTVYDEVVIETEKGKYTLEEICEIFCQCNPVFKGIPLKGEGFISKRYHK
jgi:DNA polymerase